jgi:hypothetical protein
MQRAFQWGFHREPHQPVKTGHMLVDAIKARCYERGYTMADLDDFCQTKRFFQKKRWNVQRIKKDPLLKAIETLGGTLHLHWGD